VHCTLAESREGIETPCEAFAASRARLPCSAHAWFGYGIDENCGLAETFVGDYDNDGFNQGLFRLRRSVCPRRNALLY
jgi:hypothetical protein